MSIFGRRKRQPKQQTGSISPNTGEGSTRGRAGAEPSPTEAAKLGKVLRAKYEERTNSGGRHRQSY